MNKIQLRVAREHLKNAKVAYQYELQDLDRYPYSTLICEPETDTQFVFSSNSEEIVIAFRGTTNLQDWATNTRIKKVPFFETSNKDIQVHLGFHRAWLSVREKLLHDIHNFEGRYVTFVGHSLGGALATLAAAYFSPIYEDCQLVTFGCPRVGNKHLKRLIRCPVYRFVNASDPVPYIPFYTMGYRHISRSINTMPWLYVLQGYAQKYHKIRSKRFIECYQDGHHSLNSYEKHLSDAYQPAIV